MNAIFPDTDNPAHLRAIRDHKRRRDGSGRSPLADNRAILKLIVQVAENRLKENPKFVALSRALGGWILDADMHTARDDAEFTANWKAAKELHWKVVYGAMIEFGERDMAVAFRVCPEAFLRIAWGFGYDAEDEVNRYHLDLQSRAAKLH